MPTKPYKGIYAIHINGKPYVGKDSRIFLTNRFTGHLAYLRNGNHNNKEMQEDFNKYGIESITYTMLCFDRNYTEDQLRDLEQHYVEKLDSFKNGYNQTKGGVGMWGYKYSEEDLRKKSERFTGEDNPSSKLTNKEFYEIVDLLKKGYTNDEIADLYGLHSRYVSLIRHKKRFKNFWKKIDYIPKQSTKGKENRMISYDTYKVMMELFKDGATNKYVTETYNLASGTASRIRHGKIYKDFYEEYNK